MPIRMAPYIQYTKIKIEQKHSYTHTRTYIKRLFEKNKDQGIGEKIIKKEAFVIQHETEYYHCWIDRYIGWIEGEKKRNEKQKQLITDVVNVLNYYPMLINFHP